MDKSLTVNRVRLPATLALACALEDTGNIFSVAQALGESDLAPQAKQTLGLLLCDIIAPLLDMGAVYADSAGHKHIDRQAVIDFGIVVCGLSRSEVMYERSLHELALYHRRLVPQRGAAITAPDAGFLADMQALFPDLAKDDPDDQPPSR